MTRVDLLTIVGIWFSGIGTFLASGVALWIASQPRRMKLRASVGLRSIVQPRKGLIKELIAFNVTNLGERPVTIPNVGWRTGRARRRQHAVVMTHEYTEHADRHASVSAVPCVEGRERTTKAI